MASRFESILCDKIGVAKAGVFEEVGVLFKYANSYKRQACIICENQERFMQ